MSNRHKHADVIHEWCEGAEIEYRGPKDPFWSTATTPFWHEHSEYRVKQKPNKHQEIIDAYHRGEECQFFSKLENDWVDFCNGHIPGWYQDHEYRIKPKVKTVVKYLWSTPEGVISGILMSEEQWKSNYLHSKDYSVKLEWSRTEFKEAV